MALHYLNPLLCAFLFACAMLLTKRALNDGAGALRSVFITNGVFFVCLTPLWWVYPGEVEWSYIWAPVAAGFAAFLGSFFSTLALKIGDVSVATPLLGAKVLFVALFSTVILGNVLPLSWWGGAIFAGLGIFFLGRNPTSRQSHQRLGLTVLLSLGSVCAFALMDILIAGWGAAFGFQRFVALQQVVTFGFSFLLIPFFDKPLSAMPRACWPWLLGGAVLIVSQFFVLNWTISTFKDPTAINVFYSSRGIWSVLLVWSVGSWVGNKERSHGWSVFVWRILGAASLFMAICLVLVD